MIFFSFRPIGNSRAGEPSKPGKILFVKFAELGSTLLAYPALTFSLQFYP
jgi:hypothetical protein